MATTKNQEIRNVAIVGTGVIGASWAALYLARGLNVVATDPAPTAEANLRRYIDAAWKDLTALGISPNGSRDHLRFTPDLKEAVADADLVQENGPERKDFKVKLFSDMDAATPKDSIIASSSSGLTMSVMQSACTNPERCVIGHPFNPPHMVPLVEVVAGAKTSPETVERAISFYTSIGKRAIHVRKEVVGHVANRLQAALYREVVYLIEQGVLDVADSDAAVCWGPGLRWGLMGPNLLFHLAGGEGGIQHFMEHLSGPLSTWWKDLGTITEFSPEVKQTIVNGVLEEAGTRTIDQLAEERDEVLLGLLALRAENGGKTFASQKTRTKGGQMSIRNDSKGNGSSERVFFLDISGGRMATLNPDGSDLQVIIEGLKRLPDGIEVDVEAGHIYWTNMGNPAKNDGFIERADLDGKNRRTIVPEGATFTPRQLKLDIKGGKVYWSDREGMRVMRANLDGSQIETLVDTSEGDARPGRDAKKWCVGIAVDHDGGKIYWTQKGPDNAGQGRIFRADLEIPKGQSAANRKDIEVFFDSLPEPIDLDLDLNNRMLYWTDRGNAPQGNTVSRAPIDGQPGKGRKQEILINDLMEGIGLSLDLKGGRMFFSDLGGSVYSAKMDGSEKRA